MIDASELNPTPRVLLASFPAHLASVVRADRVAHYRRREELANDWLLLCRENELVRRASHGFGTAGAYVQRLRGNSARFDPKKVSGCVADCNPHNTGSWTIIQGSLLDGSAFDAASWTKTNMTVTANDIAAPDSTVTADRLTTTQTTGAVVQNLPNIAASSSLNVPAVFTIYAKYSNRQWLCFATRGATANNQVFFDIQNGVVGYTGIAMTGAAITSVGGGWYKCDCTMTLNGSGAASISLFLSSTDGPTLTRAQGDVCWVWGCSVSQPRVESIVNQVSYVTMSSLNVNGQGGWDTQNGITYLKGWSSPNYYITTEAAAVAPFQNAVALTAFAVVSCETIDSQMIFLGGANSGANATKLRRFKTSTTGGGRFQYQTIDDAGAALQSERAADSASNTLYVFEFWTPGNTCSISLNGDAASPNAVAHVPATTVTIDRVALLGNADSVPDAGWRGLQGRTCWFNRELLAAERSYVRVGLGVQHLISVTP